jgi:hypothetical protein
MDGGVEKLHLATQLDESPSRELSELKQTLGANINACNAGEQASMSQVAVAHL